MNDKYSEETLQTLFDIILAEGMTNRLLAYISLSGRTVTQALIEIITVLDEVEPNEHELDGFFRDRLV